MSSAHLAAGSEEPPRTKGLLRLYSNRFCPYVERVRLVLSHKGIPHDVVNINLHSKPEWYFKIHPEGKVPSLLDGSKIIIESLDISDYLDEKFPQNSLYPTSAELKKRDKDLISKIGPITQIYYQCAFSDGSKTPEEWVKEFLVPLQDFENELSKRGTTFFGGEKPGMVDYMLWPWAERAGCLALKLDTKLPIKDDQIPLLRKWKKSLENYPVVSEIVTPTEAHWKIYQSRVKGTPPNYDD